MASYVCRVGAPDGSVAVRTVEAPDEETAREEVTRQGGRIFSIKAEKGVAALKLSALAKKSSGKPVKLDEFLVFNQELVALLKAGLPIVTSFETLLERQKNPRFKAILIEIRDQITSGVALSDAFLAHGDAFPKLYSTSLKAGERSGEIEKVIRRYLSYQKILGSVQRKVVSALVYPSVLVVLSLGLITVMLTFVIPKFTEFYAGFGGELPMLTRVVIATANFTKAYFLELVLGVAVGVYVFRQWLETPDGRRNFDAILLKLPLVGHILHQFALSQFSRSLGTLVGAGTPLVTALEICSGSIANRRIAVAVDTIAPKVRQGAEVWRSLEETKLFSSLTVEMVKVGEATGAMEEMLLNVSEFYDESIDTALQRLINLIEPLILIIMGGVIATILLSVYLPMFTILNQIK
jgi:type IV pilus assembly protein PilC